MTKRLLSTALALTCTAALTACGSDDKPASSSVSSTSSSSSSSSSTTSTASSSSSGSSESSQSASSAQTSSSAPITSASSSTGSNSTGSSSTVAGPVLDDKGLIALLKKIGCSKPQVEKAPAEATKAFGVESSIQCDNNGDGNGETVSFRTTTADKLEPAMKAAFTNPSAKNQGRVYYVKGTNWAVFVSPDGEKMPTKEGTTQAQQKIGAGEVASLDIKG